MINYTEKGIGLFEFLAAQGYTLYQLDGVWTAEPPGNDDIVNALIAAYQPPATPRVLPFEDFLLRMPADLPGRVYALCTVNPRLAASWAMLFTQSAINLDHGLLARELDYLETLSDAAGPLLTSEQRAALVA